jgi:hypothetical protein
MSEGRLAVVRDGVELPEEQARALWRAFSEHMERSTDGHEGFARAHGFASVKAEHRRGRAVLVVASVVSYGERASRPSGVRRATTSRPSRASSPPLRAAGARRR